MMPEGLMIFLMSQAIFFFGVLITAYIKISSKLKELEIRMALVERQDNLILQKLDSISGEIGEIKVEMQNKQNRE